MAALKWDQTGERFYEAGVEKGVLYPQTKPDGGYAYGVAWNGLINVSESPSGGEPTPLYADNTEYAKLMSNEKFTCSIEAYTYPDEFAVCDGTAELSEGVIVGQQTRKPFGLCYTSLIGNDVDGLDNGKKIHIVYGALASPSEKGYSTVNDSPDAITFSWNAEATPIEVPGLKPSATITIDSRKVHPKVLEAIEAKLYGTEDEEPTLLTPTELKQLIETTPTI